MISAAVAGAMASAQGYVDSATVLWDDMATHTHGLDSPSSDLAGSPGSYVWSGGSTFPVPGAIPRNFGNDLTIDGGSNVVIFEVYFDSAEVPAEVFLDVAGVAGSGEVGAVFNLNTVSVTSETSGGIAEITNTGGVKTIRITFDPALLSSRDNQEFECSIVTSSIFSFDMEAAGVLVTESV